jgi:hypothetical protein
MVLGVGWHGASGPVVVIIRLDASFYEREEDSNSGELTCLLCKLKKARGAQARTCCRMQMDLAPADGCTRLDDKRQRELTGAKAAGERESEVRYTQ